MGKKGAGTRDLQRKTGARATTLAQLKHENAELRAHLEEMRETLRAIKTGEVDALFMHGRVYSLQGAETPYRILVESMNEGAATLSPEGTILYCNKRFSALLDIPMKTLIGSQLRRYVQVSEQPSFDALLASGKNGLSKGECTFQTRTGNTKTIQCSFSPFAAEGTVVRYRASGTSCRDPGLARGVSRTESACQCAHAREEEQIDDQSGNDCPRYAV